MRDDGNTYIGTRLCWRDHLGCAPVDLQTNLARHLDWYCGWNLATALVVLLFHRAGGKPGEELAGKPCGWMEPPLACKTSPSFLFALRGIWQALAQCGTPLWE